LLKDNRSFGLGLKVGRAPAGRAVLTDRSMR
jgi:hypothetical protein